MCTWRTIYRMDGNAQYSEPFARGGPSAVFSMDVTALADSPAFVVTVQHKNDKATTWDDAASFTGIGSTGTFTKYISGLKEMLRFKYTFTSSDEQDGVTFVCPIQLVAWLAL